MRTPLSQRVLTLYDDPFLGGAVADFVELAVGQGGPCSTGWPSVIERLERRGFDVDGLEDRGDLEVPEASSAARWLASAARLPAASGRKGRGTSIRIRAWGDRVGVRWTGGAADWDLCAPNRLVVVCEGADAVWAYGEGHRSVGAALERAKGCVRLRAMLVVDGHPEGLPAAELAIWWASPP